jgi:hypothetical protein
LLSEEPKAFFALRVIFISIPGGRSNVPSLRMPMPIMPAVAISITWRMLMLLKF